MAKGKPTRLSNRTRIDHLTDPPATSHVRCRNAVAQPELKRYLNKRVCVNLQGGRRIVGQCSGYDIFMNLVIDDAVEQVHPPINGAAAASGGPVQENRNVWQDGARLGMVVSRREGTDGGTCAQP